MRIKRMIIESSEVDYQELRGIGKELRRSQGDNSLGDAIGGCTRVHYLHRGWGRYANKVVRQWGNRKVILEGMDLLYIVRRARGIRSAQQKDVVRGGFDLQQFRWERSYPTRRGYHEL